MANNTVKGSSRTATSGLIHAQVSGIRVSSTRVAVFGVAVADPIKLDVYFDYQCPFVYRMAGLLDALARDHTQAVQQEGVFGTPTLVFANGGSAYVRLAEGTYGDRALKVFDQLVSVAASEQQILEIKRPRRPSPR